MKMLAVIINNALVGRAPEAYYILIMSQLVYCMLSSQQLNYL